jgi:hypothetical protein
MVTLMQIQCFRATAPHAVLPRAHLSHKTGKKAPKTIAEGALNSSASQLQGEIFFTF